MTALPASIIRGASRATFKNCTPEAMKLFDNSYVCLDPNRVHEYFSKVSGQALDALGLWRKDVRDCDKFSRLVAAIAVTTHAIHFEKEAGLAFGIISYTKDSGERHSINLLICKEANSSRLHLMTFEPQTGLELTLSQAERDSVSLLLI